MVLIIVVIEWLLALLPCVIGIAEMRGVIVDVVLVVQVTPVVAIENVLNVN